MYPNMTVRLVISSLILTAVAVRFSYKSKSVYLSYQCNHNPTSLLLNHKWKARFNIDSVKL